VAIANSSIRKFFPLNNAEMGNERKTPSGTKTRVSISCCFNCARTGLINHWYNCLDCFLSNGYKSPL